MASFITNGKEMSYERTRTKPDFWRERTEYWHKRYLRRNEAVKVWRGLARQYEFDLHMEEDRADRVWKVKNVWVYSALILLAGFVYLVITI